MTVWTEGPKGLLHFSPLLERTCIRDRHIHWAPQSTNYTVNGLQDWPRENSDNYTFCKTKRSLT